MKDILERLDALTTSLLGPCFDTRMLPGVTYDLVTFDHGAITVGFEGSRSGFRRIHVAGTQGNVLQLERGGAQVLHLSAKPADYDYIPSNFVSIEFVRNNNAMQPKVQSRFSGEDLEQHLDATANLLERLCNVFNGQPKETGPV